MLIIFSSEYGEGGSKTLKLGKYSGMSARSDEAWSFKTADGAALTEELLRLLGFNR